MKCAACQYDDQDIMEEKIECYTVGAKKGQVKRSYLKREARTKFIPLKVEKGFDFLRYVADTWEDDKYTSVNLYICPKCGTIKTDGDFLEG